MSNYTVSIVATVFNEEENIIPVCKEIKDVLPELPECEVVFVNDGSSDHTLDRLIEVKNTFLPALKIVSYDQCCGKSAALSIGIKAAEGKWIATLDGDGQDDPRDFIGMWKIVQAHLGKSLLVVGARLERNDRLSRRLATRFANGLRSRLLKDGCPDTGAPMKIFLKDDFMRLPEFEGLHRFLPALLGRYGVPFVCYAVHHRQRLNGFSKYTNFNRALVGVRDLLGVMWLLNRIRFPDKIKIL